MAKKPTKAAVKAMTWSEKNKQIQTGAKNWAEMSKAERDAYNESCSAFLNELISRNENQMQAAQACVVPPPIMAKKRNAPKTLADATSNEIAALASALVRRPTPAVLNTTPPIPCDFVAAVAMKFACSREEAGTIPLDDLRAELSTAVGREHWSALLKQYDYRIDVPAEAPLQSGPSAREMARVRDAIKAAGKRATPARVLAMMKGDNTEGKGMRRTVFLECLKHLAANSRYSGHKRAR